MIEKTMLTIYRAEELHARTQEPLAKTIRRAIGAAYADPAAHGLAAPSDDVAPVTRLQVRLSEAEREQLQRLANANTGGNLSAMVALLLAGEVA